MKLSLPSFLLVWSHIFVFADGQANCTAEVELFHDCVRLSGGILSNGTNLCGACLTSLWPSSGEWCDLVDPTCIGLETCNECSSCGDEFLDYLACNVDGACDVSCNAQAPVAAPASVPFAAPAPMPSAAPTLAVCPDEKAAFDQCLEDNGLGYTCGPCVAGYWPTEIEFCSDVDDETCYGVEQCATSCGDCGPYLINYVDCVFGCPITCPDSSPTQAPVMPSAAPTTTRCPDERAAFDQCLDDNGLGRSCETCVVGFWPSEVDACTDFDDETCDGIEKCSTVCGDCGPDFISYVNCLAAETCDEITCPAPAPTGSPTSDVVVPTQPPEPTTCPEQYDDLQDCLHTQVSIAEKEACQGCMDSAYSRVLGGEANITTATCMDMNDVLCPALLEACDCSVCQDEYSSFLDCRMRSEAGCSLQCAALPTGTSGGHLCVDLSTSLGYALLASLTLLVWGRTFG